MMRCLLFACVALCVVGGCANRSTRSDVLTIAQWSEPVSLNPLYLQGQDAADIGALGYSFLTKYDARDAIVPDAAAIVPTIENGGISRDGKRITYHLRRDVRWQDGQPLTARDVVFTYRAIMNPSNAVQSRSGYDHITGIWARGPYAVVVDLARPQASFVSGFFGGDSSYAILPAHLLAARPNLNHVSFNQLPIGSGPYRFTKWIRGERLDLMANDRYYGTKPAIRYISMRFIHDHTTIANELMTNEVNATFVASPSQIAAIRSIPNHRVIVTRPIPSFETIAFNLRDPVVGDLSVRRALALAIDRRVLTAKATLGLYDADAAMRGMFTWAFDPKAGTIAYDPIQAQALLSKNGWTRSNDGVRLKNGRRLELQFAFVGQSFVAAEVVPLIIEEAHTVGIDLVAKAYDLNELYSLHGPLYNGTFQTALLGLGSNVDPDPSTYLSCEQIPPNGFNFARYCSEEVEHALRRALSLYGRADRRRIYSSVQRRLLADVPYYVLWQAREIDVIPSALRGYEPSAISPYDSVGHWQLQH